MTNPLRLLFLTAAVAVVGFGGAAHALARGESGVAEHVPPPVISRPVGSKAYGISARIAQISTSDILNGHAAGWVGVGGPGQGPNGSNEWIQVGYVAFPSITTGSDIYYEVALPGRNPTYHQVSTGVPVGIYTKVTVLEMHNRPNLWRVWVNHMPVSPPIKLPGSHDGLPRTTKSWNPDGTTSGRCNNSLYRFNHVSIARAPGGNWQHLTDC
jgi:hypothetical protein